MLKVFLSGVPSSGIDIIKDALSQAFNEPFSVEELTSSTLRSRVRLSRKSIEVVLVVLDSEAEEICRGIEDGLYSCNKYHCYSSDYDLAMFLNSKYSLNIKVAEEEKPIKIDTEIYEEKLRLKESIVANLEQRILDLEAFYTSSDYVVSSELEESLKKANSKNQELEASLSTLKEVNISLENRLKMLSKNMDELVLELDSLKAIYSEKSSIVAEKEIEIGKLNAEVKKLQGVLAKNKELNTLVDNLKNSSLELNTKIEEYENDISRLTELSNSKDSEIEVLSKNLSDISVSLEEQLAEKSNVISSISEKLEYKNKEVEDLLVVKNELSNMVSTLDSSIIQLNKDKLELANKVSMLEKVSSLDNGTSSLLKEIDDLNKKVHDLSFNIFNKIGFTSQPLTKVGGRVLEGSGRFNNIRFAFAGSTESRRGAYKCILNEVSSSKDKYLLVDLVSETCVDYVFQIRNMVNGLDWFKTGGNLEKYLSKTSVSNISVLSLGLSYINDSYFLSVDWASRLVELDNCGYKVILFCGDISNLVGRVLHESFVEFGETIIYVLGNVVSSRAIITNLKGLTSSKDIIAYFDYNDAISRFYNIVSNTNECRVLSSKAKRR